MDVRSEFTIVVRSTDCANYFPTNTPGDFYVRLPHKIELTSDWSLTVSEIWITKHWYNMHNSYVEICLGGDVYEKTAILSGYYHDNSRLVEELNKIGENTSDGAVIFSYDTRNQRLYVGIRAGVKVKLSPSLCTMLGHDVGVPITGAWVSPLIMDVHRGDRLIYVHTDISRGQVFSDDILPIVKVVATDCYDFGSVIHDINVGVQIPVDKKSFDVIHIELRDSSNDIIKFEAGVTMVQLHFIRR
jgi:hypothetical protein